MRSRSGLSFLLVLVLLASLLAGAACAAKARPSPGSTATPVVPSPVGSATPIRTPEPTVLRTQAPLPTLAPRTVSLPADDAPHPEATTEWWYYNGRLETSAARQFGFHYVVFVVRLPGFPPVQIAHFAVTDMEAEVNVGDQRAMFETSSTNSTADAFRFDIRGWRLEGSGGNDRLAAGTDRYALDLTLLPGKSSVLHGGSGLLDVSSAGQDSYYYSRTRMAAGGSVTVGTETLDVTGTAWFDHQWGNFSALAIGWDWFALQLNDGSEVMLYRIRDLSTRDEFDYGTLIDRDGRATELGGTDFKVFSSGTWVSPSTGIEYPSGWTVAVPSFGIEVEVDPLVEGSEFDARVTTRNVYWEGLVKVSGSHSGWGFVELVGYGLATAPVTPTAAAR